MNTCFMTVTVTAMYMCIHACACVHVYACVGVICECMCTCMRACVRISIHLLVLMHASLCIFHSSDKYLTARRRVWNVILTGLLNRSSKC